MNRATDKFDYPRELAALFALTVTEEAKQSLIAKNGETSLYETLAQVFPQVVLNYVVTERQ